MVIDAKGVYFKNLNNEIKNTNDYEIIINNCIGQRYIASGMSGKKIKINGIPGNALGSYLNGCEIFVNGNTQDAAGDTMNEGSIYIKGSSGDATGYAMRGGKIFVKDNIGYRAGIHMKEYGNKIPVLVAGGEAGSFLGEYQAGGIIIVLGLNSKGKIPVGRFCAAGMHGGKIYLRTKKIPFDIPEQVNIYKAQKSDIDDIYNIILEYCNVFEQDIKYILESDFYVLKANTKNPYKQLYVHV